MAIFAAGLSFNLVEKWLGHAQLPTTTVYAIDAEEKEYRQENAGESGTVEGFTGITGHARNPEIFLCFRPNQTFVYTKS